MTLISKTDLLLQRDEKGRLLPQRVAILQANGHTREVVLSPMTRGEILRIRRLQETNPQEDTDLTIAREHLLEPNLLPAEWDLMKSSFVTAIAQAVIRISTSVEPGQDAEAELKKS